MLKKGDRIELIRMGNDPDPIEPGTQGKVVSVNDVSMGRENFTQIDVKWDNGRTLMVCCPPDAVRRIG